MQDLKERVNNLFAGLEKLKGAFDLIEKKKKVEILEAESSDPNLWSNQEKAKKVLQELSDLKKELSEVEDLTSTIFTLKELSDGGAETSDFEKEIINAEKKEPPEAIKFPYTEIWKIDAHPAIKIKDTHLFNFNLLLKKSVNPSTKKTDSIILALKTTITHLPASPTNDAEISGYPITPIKLIKLPRIIVPIPKPIPIREFLNQFSPIPSKSPNFEILPQKI